MKHKLSVLFLGLVMIFAMAVPAFAASYPVPPEGDIYWVYKSMGNTYANCVSGNIVSITLSDNGSYVVTFAEKPTSARYAYNNDTWGSRIDLNFSNSLSIPASNGSPATLQTNVTDLYLLYSKCDGSTCPATDADYNNICDDCGMTFAVLRNYEFETVDIVVKHSEELTLKFSFVETDPETIFGATYSDERITITFDKPVNHYQYKLVDGEWEDYSSFTNIYGYHTISLPSNAQIQSSDLTVYDTDGNVFFQNPLWMQVGYLTEGEVAEALETIQNQMGLLTVCGIGCLVLLIGLVLLAVKFRVFLR